jgi:hypothetical protein
MCEEQKLTSGSVAIATSIADSRDDGSVASIQKDDGINSEAKNRIDKRRKNGKCENLDEAGKMNCIRLRRRPSRYCTAHGAQHRKRKGDCHKKSKEVKKVIEKDWRERGVLGRLEADEPRDRVVLERLLEKAENLWKRVSPKYDFKFTGKDKGTRGRVDLEKQRQGISNELQGLVNEVSRMVIQKCGVRYQHLTTAGKPIFVVVIAEADKQQPENVKKLRIHRDHECLDYPQLVTVELLLNNIDFWNGSVQF